MRGRVHAVGWTLIVILFGACKDASPNGFGSTGDGGPDATASVDSGSSDEAETQDGGGSPPPDAGNPNEDADVPSDGSAQDTGPVDTGIPEVGPTTCQYDAGNGADYQASCTSCNLSPSCLLSCASCTNKGGSQVNNPSVQLPCPAGEAVQNNDGILTCQ
jgi:hypothetical protein